MAQKSSTTHWLVSIAVVGLAGLTLVLVYATTLQHSENRILAEQLVPLRAAVGAGVRDDIMIDASLFGAALAAGQMRTLIIVVGALCEECDKAIKLWTDHLASQPRRSAHTLWIVNVDGSPDRWSSMLERVSHDIKYSTVRDVGAFSLRTGIRTVPFSGVVDGAHLVCGIFGAPSMTGLAECTSAWFRDEPSAVDHVFFETVSEGRPLDPKPIGTTSVAQIGLTQP